MIDASKVGPPLGAEPPSYGATEPVRVFQWEDNGAPWTLLLGVAAFLSTHHVALILLCFQLFFVPSLLKANFPEARRAKYGLLMHCNPMDIGFPKAYFCEFTKAAARCFPLLALAALQLVAARLIVNQRAYYLLLRHGVLIRFERCNPAVDPVNKLLLVTAAFALFHFVQKVWESDWYNKTVGVGEVVKLGTTHEELILFYIIPMFYLLYILFLSVNVADKLLPLSQFWDEDPEWARAASSELVVVEERDLAEAAAGKGFYLGKGGDGDAAASFSELAEAIKRLPRAVGGATCGRHMPTMWATRLLLDSRLRDSDASHFRLAWTVWSCTSLGVLAMVFGFFMYQIHADVQDIIQPPHQYTDIPSLLFNVAYLLFVAVITHGYWLDLRLCAR